MRNNFNLKEENNSNFFGTDLSDAHSVLTTMGSLTDIRLLKDSINELFMAWLQTDAADSIEERKTMITRHYFLNTMLDSVVAYNELQCHEN
jgi:hypothetical protein